MMIRPHHEREPWRATRRRERRAGPEHSRVRPHSIRLTADGFPAAEPDATKPSPVVYVSSEGRARFPWLPRRVIAGSVWRGPCNERVRVDQAGHVRAA